jgi:hypothetical protein
MRIQWPRITPLVSIKLLQSVVWLFFAGCIVGIPFAAAYHRSGWVVFLTAMVLMECAVLAVNRGRCPLTSLASNYIEERKDNFDIYLPLWLTRHNKAIFGTLFAIGELFALGQWLTSSR